MSAHVAFHLSHVSVQNKGWPYERILEMLKVDIQYDYNTNNLLLNLDFNFVTYLKKYCDACYNFITLRIST